MLRILVLPNERYQCAIRKEIQNCRLVFVYTATVPPAEADLSQEVASLAKLRSV
jgi:hypothetical protein